MSEPAAGPDTARGTAGEATRAAARAAERAAREAYGRMVALLAYRWRDVAAAEDAMGNALAAALTTWPRDGVPNSPEAWLMAVAKRELLQAARHARVVADPAVQVLLEAEAEAPTPADVPDDRLRLMFVCAHPALPAAMHAPLMLQTVLGVEAGRLADAFLVAPSAMAQRLVRAKAKIRDSGIRFEEPEARELPARLEAVLEALYAAYTIGRQAALGAEALEAAPLHGLREEAVLLARLVAGLMSDDQRTPAAGRAEALGLLALILHAEARRPAQSTADGAFVPLLQQDTGRWELSLIREAEALLWRAQALHAPGRFQLEAAIQSAHAQRRTSGSVPWYGIAQLYAVLVTMHPTIGARVGQAVALAEAGANEAGLEVLEALDPASVRSYQPYWVARDHLLRRLGRVAEADAARTTAIGLTESPALRAHLARH